MRPKPPSVRQARVAFHATLAALVASLVFEWPVVTTVAGTVLIFATYWLGFANGREGKRG